MGCGTRAVPRHNSLANFWLSKSLGTEDASHFSLAPRRSEHSANRFGGRRILGFADQNPPTAKVRGDGALSPRVNELPRASGVSGNDQTGHVQKVSHRDVPRMGKHGNNAKAVASNHSTGRPGRITTLYFGSVSDRVNRSDAATKIVGSMPHDRPVRVPSPHAPSRCAALPAA